MLRLLLSLCVKTSPSDKWPHLNGSSDKVKTQNGPSAGDLLPSWGSFFSLDCLVKQGATVLVICHPAGLEDLAAGRNQKGKLWKRNRRSLACQYSCVSLQGAHIPVQAMVCSFCYARLYEHKELQLSTPTS